MTKAPQIRPIWIVALIVLVLALWLASGMIGNGSGNAAAPAADESGPEPVSVEVRTSVAEPVTRNARLNGQTAPVRAVTLQARTAGRVSELVAARGDRVQDGDVLLRIALDDRVAQRAEARATVEQRRLQHEAVSEMTAQGYQTRTDLAVAYSDLEAAQAQLAQIEQDIDNTVVRAPFSGILEDLPVEVGSSVGVGDELARVVQQDPFIVTGDVAETDVVFVETGQPGTAQLVSGETVSGTVRYVASEADPDTRTYRVELEVDNPNGRLISGASAKLILPLETVSAHAVAPDLLTLDAHGAMGVKMIDNARRVHFHAADIVKSLDDTVWLSGLPERILLIPTGQGFTRVGDTVAVAGRQAAAEAGNNKTPAPDPS